MCILISLVLWFTLSMREVHTDVVSLPTQVEQLPEDQALSRLPPRVVQVEIQGQGFQLLGLHYNKPTVTIDAQQQEVDLTRADLDLPKDIEIRTISPSRFVLQKEAREKKKVPVRLIGSIETPTNYDLIQDPQLSPDSIIVTGARSIIDNLSYWPTKSLHVEGLKDSLVVTVPLADTLDGLVNRSHLATTVTAAARFFTEATREIPVDVTGINTSEKVVTLVPSKVRITYRVPLEQYDEAQAAPDFFATVAYSDIRADTTGRVRPHLSLPPDLVIRNYQMIPPTLNYYERLVDQ